MFSKPTLSGILKNFTTTINKLEELIAANNQQVDKNFQQIDQLNQLNGALLEEASTATNVKNKLKELTGGNQ